MEVEDILTLSSNCQPDCRLQAAELQPTVCRNALITLNTERGRYLGQHISINDGEGDKCASKLFPNPQPDLKSDVKTRLRVVFSVLFVVFGSLFCSD